MSVEIERALGRIEGKLDLLIPALGVQETRLTSMSGRVSKLEKWQSKVLGGAVAAGFLLGLVMRALHL
jgi:hypothetical protein